MCTFYFLLDVDFHISALTKKFECSNYPYTSSAFEHMFIMFSLEYSAAVDYTLYNTLAIKVTFTAVFFIQDMLQKQ